ncbi:hypothetical protein OROMI_028748 [Orobanche minor]
MKPFFYKCCLLLIILLFQVYIMHFNYNPAPPTSTSIRREDYLREDFSKPPISESDNCRSAKVYVYDLPVMFNRELLDSCRDLDPWHSRCNAISKDGLGPRAVGLSGVPENLAPSWHWTDMFAVEVLYHARILNHECRTTEQGSATAFYIPFYAGLAVGKYLLTNHTAEERDAHCERLLTWLRYQPPWGRSNGSDHFITLGRMTWDFRRLGNDRDGWGSSFIHMPLMRHVLRLAVERDPWDHLEVGVPYPTGFHPKSKSELDQWLDFVQSRERTSLFTFVGARRRVKGDFRTLLLSHCCNESDWCRVVDCSGTRCYDGTSEILEAFLDSDFCLQPRGDTYTRRSTFDCMLAGSIPVFFRKRNIHNQYQWFLGDDPEKFSVLIDRKDVRDGSTSIRKALEGYSRDEVREMRERVISIIPKIVYSNVASNEVRIDKDAFDVAIDGVLRRFQEQKMKGIGEQLLEG